MDFGENVSFFFLKCVVLCAPAHRVPAVETQAGGHRRLRVSFPSRTHALDGLQPSPDRFGNFYFSMKIMNFQDFQGF